MPEAATVSEAHEATATPIDQPSTATATPSQAVATPALAPDLSLRDRLVSRGIDTSGFQDDDEAFDALMNTWERSVASQDEFDRFRAQHGESFQKYLDNRDKYEEWLKQQQPAAPTAAAPGEPDEWKWEAPEYKPEWQYLRGPDGKWLPDIDASVPGKYAKAQQFLQEKVQAFFFGNPQEFIQRAMAGDLKTLREQAVKEARESIMQELAQQQHVSRQQAYLEANKKRFIAMNDKDEPLRDASGNVSLTPEGNALATYLNNLQQVVADPNLRLEIAEMAVERDRLKGLFGAPTAATNGNGKPPVEEAKKRFVDLNREPDRDGVSPPDPTATLNPEADFARSTRAEMRKRGIIR